MYCLRQQKATDLMKYTHETCVATYWNLGHNAISLIEDNTFNNLPILRFLRISFSIIYRKVCSLYDYYIKQIVDKCALRILPICHRYETPT